MGAARRGGWSTVLFDLDDTLLDSHASQRAAYDATMHSVGLDDPETHRPTYDRLNQALWRQVEEGTIRPDDVRVRRFEEFCAVVGLDADPHAMAETFVDGLVRFGELLPGAAELLGRLLGRVRLGLVTNGIGSVQRGRLVRLGLTDTFDAIVISGEVGVAKPDPAIFDLVAAELGIGLARGEVVMVGDSLSSDVAGAHAAGIDSIWMSSDGASTGVAASPTHRVVSIDEIAALVDPG